MRILLAEDDPLLGDGLRNGLRQQGFQVDWVRDGLAAEREIATEVYQAAVLDLGLPRQDGLEALTRLRDRKVGTPILVLTARDGVRDRIRGLDLGADDYVLKPVDLEELAARLRALIRRSHGLIAECILYGRLRIDPAAREVLLDGEPVALAQREYVLLVSLLLQAGRVLTRDQLEQHMYGWGQDVESNTIEVHVHHLRRKLYPELIQTVRGVGYTIPRLPE